MKRLKFYVTMFIVNNILKGTHFFSLKRILLNGTGRYHIGRDSKIVGPLYSNANIYIRDNVWVGRNFKVEGNGEVIIGDNCDIAPNVTFYTGYHDIGDRERRAGKGHNGSITIGKGTWICGSAIVVPNIEIGDGSIVAAGAVVTKNVENNTMVGGCPAIVIKGLE